MKKISILQGDIWIIDFNPTIGDEIQKKRPAVVINSNFGIGLDLKIVVPVTTWKKEFENIWWLYKLNPDKSNGLTDTSAVNCYQMLCVSDIRFIKKLGSCIDDIEEIISTVQNCVEVI